MGSAWAPLPEPRTEKRRHPSPASVTPERDLQPIVADICAGWRREAKSPQNDELESLVQSVVEWLNCASAAGTLSTLLCFEEELATLDCLSVPRLAQVAEDNWDLAVLAARLALKVVLNRETPLLLLYGVGEAVELEQLGSDKMHKLIRTEGYVLKESPPELLVMSMDFRCEQCGHVCRRNFPGGEFSPPPQCLDECGAKSFFPLRRTAKCAMSQRLVLQELRTRRKRPMIFVAELREPLTGRVRMGDEVELVAQPRPEKLEREEGFGKATDAGLFTVVLEARSIRPKSAQITEDAGLPASLLEREVAFEALIASFRSDLSLNELAKAFVILTLCSKQKMPLLLVEESNGGAAGLLEFAEEIAIRTVKGDNFELFPTDRGEEGGIEPGKILMCNKGFCAVPHLAAMKKPELAKLFGAIESQKVVVRDAECFTTVALDVVFICALRATTGNFEQLLAEHGQLPRGTFSKFDFVVPVVHDPAYLRLAVAEKLLRKPPPRPAPRDPRAFPFSTIMQARIEKLAENALTLDALGCQALLKRIENAVDPVLSKEVAVYLRDFFESLHQISSLTPAFFAALLRLVKSRARIDLRPSVSFQHADEIIEIIRELLSSSLYSQSSSQRGDKPSKPASQLSLPKKHKILLDELKAMRESRQSGFFRLEEIRAIVNRLDLRLDDFLLFIERLNMEGTLLNKGNGVYELSSSL